MAVGPETVTVHMGTYGTEEEPTGSDLRSLGEGRWLWAPLFVTFDEPDRPVVAELTVVVGDEGRPQVIRVETRAREGFEVTSEALRIPLADIVRRAVEISSFDGPDADPGARPELGQPFLFGESTGPVSMRRRRTARTDDRLRRVAELYRAAEWGERGQAVADALHVSVNTARNLISEARRRGFLEERSASGERSRGDD